MSRADSRADAVVTPPAVAALNKLSADAWRKVYTLTRDIPGLGRVSVSYSAGENRRRYSLDGAPVSQAEVYRRARAVKS